MNKTVKAFERSFADRTFIISFMLDPVYNLRVVVLEKASLTVVADGWTSFAIKQALLHLKGTPKESFEGEVLFTVNHLKDNYRTYRQETLLIPAAIFRVNEARDKGYLVWYERSEPGTRSVPNYLKLYGNEKERSAFIRLIEGLAAEAKEFRGEWTRSGYEKRGPG